METSTQNLTEKNPVNAPLSREANTVDWTIEDQNEALENLMLWKSIKGANTQMPASNTAFREASEEP